MSIPLDDWNTIVRKAAETLGLDIISHCDDLNTKVQPRYFHVNAISKQQNATVWRLKTVNLQRTDKAAIQNCNSYNNCVHARLAKASSFQEIVIIPAYLDLPPQYLDNLSCSELIEGRKPEPKDIDLLVELLIKLQQHRRNIVRQLNQLPLAILRPINIHNQPHYRERFTFSLESLQKKGLLSRDEAFISISIFDTALSSPVEEDDLCFVHGDFSFGNLKVVDNSIAIIDYEHSHIGIGQIDLAHLYINLIADEHNELAVALLDSYREKAFSNRVSYDDSIFHALTLERGAGKMNSMIDTTGDRWERLKRILLTKGVRM